MTTFQQSMTRDFFKNLFKKKTKKNTGCKGNKSLFGMQNAFETLNLTIRNFLWLGVETKTNKQKCCYFESLLPIANCKNSEVQIYIF